MVFKTHFQQLMSMINNSLFAISEHIHKSCKTDIICIDSESWQKEQRECSNKVTVKTHYFCLLFSSLCCYLLIFTKQYYWFLFILFAFHSSNTWCNRAILECFYRCPQVTFRTDSPSRSLQSLLNVKKKQKKTAIINTI